MVVLAVLAAVGVLVVTVRAHRRPGARMVRAVAGYALSQLLFVAAAGLLLNDQVGFYASWSDLAGSAQTVPPPGSPSGVRIPTGALDASRGAGSRIVAVTIIGGRSRLARPGFVYLPAAYFDPRLATRRFPALELLDGFPGSPYEWLWQLQIRARLDAEIAAGRMEPVIAVMPNQTAGGGHDSECVNAVYGEQDETYLTTDLQTAVARRFRVMPGPRGWALMGPSTGGFCAVNLALRNPARYAAAASLSGYFTAVTDATTGDLYAGRRTLRRANSPLWWVEHRPARGVALFLGAGGSDGPAVTQLRRFAAQARRRGYPLTTVVTRRGGHNFGVWRRLLGPALDWTAVQLAPPLAPAPPGARVPTSSPPRERRT